MSDEPFQFMQQVIQSRTLLQNMRELSSSFRMLLKSKKPELLDEWMSRAVSFNIPEINLFVKGLMSGLNAVKNVIIYPWTNSLVERNVNRLKTRKQEMYG